MVIQFDTTIEEFVDVTIRSIKRSETLRAWHWQGIASMVLIAGVPGFSLASGSITVRLVIAFVAAVIAVALYLWTSHNTLKERIEKLCREQMGTNGPVGIKVELDDSVIAISQSGIKTTYNWETIEGFEETDDAVYLYTKDKGCFAVRKRGFDSTEIKNQFMEIVRRRIESSQPPSEPTNNGNKPVSGP